MRVSVPIKDWKLESKSRTVVQPCLGFIEFNGLVHMVMQRVTTSTADSVLTCCGNGFPADAMVEGPLQVTCIVCAAEPYRLKEIWI